MALDSPAKSQSQIWLRVKDNKKVKEEKWAWTEVWGKTKSSICQDKAIACGTTYYGEVGGGEKQGREMWAEDKENNDARVGEERKRENTNLEAKLVERFPV